MAEPEAVKRENILQIANGLIHGDRRKDSGHPIDNFTRTAEIWSAILSKKLKRNITPEEVGLMLIGLKLSRCANKITRDSLIDMAGYSGTVEMVIEAQTADEEDHE